MTIPRNIHYVWVGSHPLPEDARQSIDQWRAVMPDFQVTEWNEGNIDFSSPFIRGAYAVRGYNRVANYARLRALYDHGGIYFDHDVEVFRSLAPLLDRDCFFGFQTLRANEPHLINNAVIGAVPKHPFIGRLLAAMDAMDGRAEVGAETGPGLVSRLMRELGVTAPQTVETIVDGVTLFPPACFYPYDWTESFDPACVTDETFAVHHWAHTWKSQPSLARRVQKKLTRATAKLSVPLAYGIQRIINKTYRQSRTARAMRG